MKTDISYYINKSVSVDMLNKSKDLGLTVKIFGGLFLRVQICIVLTGWLGVFITFMRAHNLYLLFT